MPIYEFKCKNCGHLQENMLKYEEVEKFLNTTKCLKCKKKTLEKIISGSNFNLVGDGYYKSGFSNKKSN